MREFLRFSYSLFKFIFLIPNPFRVFCLLLHVPRDNCETSSGHGVLFGHRRSATRSAWPPLTIPLSSLSSSVFSSSDIGGMCWPGGSALGGRFATSSFATWFLFTWVCSSPRQSAPLSCKNSSFFLLCQITPLFDLHCRVRRDYLLLGTCSRRRPLSFCRSRKGAT